MWNSKVINLSKMLYFSLLFSSLFLSTLCHDDGESKSVKYTTTSFNLGLESSNHFVMFYAPWCGHCSRLAPTWEELANHYNEATVDSEVVIAKVDCTTETPLCSDHDVTGYPTLKFYKMGQTTGVKYRGKRDFDALKDFVDENLGKSSKEDDTGSSVAVLTEDNFRKYIDLGNHFVYFYAPWCGHCKIFSPTWDKLAESLKIGTGTNVRFSKVNCVEQKSICENKVTEFPTLLWIENGKSVDKYTGDRSIEDLKEFVYRQLGIEYQSKENLNVPTINNPVMLLTSDNFADFVAKEFTFVKFFAPWCGHCKRMAPAWNELAKKFFNHPQVSVAKVDCTLEVNSELCADQKATGFPSLFLYKDGEKISVYEGNRQLNDMYEFVNKFLQSHDEL